MRHFDAAVGRISGIGRIDDLMTNNGERVIVAVLPNNQIAKLADYGMFAVDLVPCIETNIFTVHIHFGDLRVKVFDECRYLLLEFGKLFRTGFRFCRITAFLWERLYNFSCSSIIEAESELWCNTYFNDIIAYVISLDAIRIKTKVWQILNITHGNSVRMQTGVCVQFANPFKKM